MKPIYRCEYCNHMGTMDELQEHEEKCFWNYNRKSCRTCKHKDPNSFTRYKCLLGTEIAEGCLIEFCGKYEYDGKNPAKSTVGDIFGGFFRGL
jgi:hypothetical protein